MLEATDQNSKALAQQGKQFRRLVESPDITMDRKELKEAITVALQMLTPREGKALRLYFGIDCENLTLREVGGIFGVGAERARQIIAIALRKIRHSTRGKLMKSYLGCVDVAVLPVFKEDETKTMPDKELQPARGLGESCGDCACWDMDDRFEPFHPRFGQGQCEIKKGIMLHSEWCKEWQGVKHG